jgi:hypothetical protein
MCFINKVLQGFDDFSGFVLGFSYAGDVVSCGFNFYWAKFY